MDFHRPRRRTRILVRFKGLQVGIDQHPMIDVLKALRPFAQSVGRGRRNHVHPDADRHVGGGVGRVAHAHGAVIHLRGGGGGSRRCTMSRMVHPRH
ncbi:hypothetical protein D3C72_2102720 [compost metagenome]